MPEVTGSTSPNSDPSLTSVSGSGLDSSVTLSQAQAIDLRQNQLMELARVYGIERYTPPPLEHWINIVDYPQVSAACLTSSGFPSVMEGGVVRTKNVAPGQRLALDRARLDCDGRFTVHPYYNLPPSAKAAGKMYDWLVDVAVPCLRSRGLSVDEPPTRETYLTSLHDVRWSPWSQALQDQITAKFSREEQQGLEKSCPSSPGVSAFNEHDPVKSTSR